MVSRLGALEIGHTSSSSSHVLDIHTTFSPVKASLKFFLFLSVVFIYIKGIH